MTPSDSDLERLFLTHLPVIDRIIAIQSRRHALSRPDADDYGSWAKAKLLDDNYAVFRKFSGRSSLSTYLAAVLANLYRDYRNAQWGRWRPSAAALRLGPIGIRLEELLYRMGHSLREATELLQSAGVDLSAAELSRMAASIPSRSPGGPVALDQVVGTNIEPATQGIEWERNEATQKMQHLVKDLIARLPAEDALLVRMRFWNDVSVADIARALHLDQKELYRRFDSIRKTLNKELASSGIRGTVAELLQDAQS